MNFKLKLKRMFCKHKNQEWMVEAREYQKFTVISGERRYLVCQDCGKVIDSYFHKYD